MHPQWTAEGFSSGPPGGHSGAPTSKKRTKVVFLNPTEITNWEDLESDTTQNLIEKNDFLQYEKLLNNKSRSPERQSKDEPPPKKRGRPKGSKNKPKKKQVVQSQPWLNSDEDDQGDAGIENELDDDDYFRRLEEEKFREEQEEAKRKMEARSKKDLHSRIGVSKLSQLKSMRRRGSKSEFSSLTGSNEISDIECDSTISSFTGSRQDYDDLDSFKPLYPHEEIDEEVEEEDPLFSNHVSPSHEEVSETEAREEEQLTSDRMKSVDQLQPTDAYTTAMLSVDPVQLLYESPRLSLPTSSSDLVCPPHCLLDALSIYEILIRYGRILRLSPFKLEDFLAALVTNENSNLLAEIHMALMKLLLHEDDAAGTVMYSSDCKDSVGITMYLLDRFSWPHLLSAYLNSIQTTEAAARSAVAGLSSISMSAAYAAGVAASGPTGCGGADTVLSATMFPSGTIPLDPNYPFVPVEKRLGVLQGLTNLFLATGPVRGDVLRDGFLPHEDHCRYCHQSGDMLCCDNCPAVFHLGCLTPPLPNVPSSTWLCPVCVNQQTPGVTDCLSEEERSGKVHRKVPIGTDRAGRVYWYTGRRLVVEPFNLSQLEPRIPHLHEGLSDPDWFNQCAAELFTSGHWQPLPQFADSSEEESLSQIGPILRCNPSVDYANEPAVYYYSSIDQVLELRQRLSPRWEPWLCQRLDWLLPRITDEMQCTEKMVQEGMDQFCRTRTAVNRLSPSDWAVSSTHKNVFSVFEVESAASKSRLASGVVDTNDKEEPPHEASCAFAMQDENGPCYPGRLPSNIPSSVMHTAGDDISTPGVIVTRDRTTCLIRSYDGLNHLVEADDHLTDQSEPTTVLTADELYQLTQFHLDDFRESDGMLIAYRLSDEGNWRRWTNIYNTSSSIHEPPAMADDRENQQPTLALTRAQFLEEKDRRRLLGNKFSLTDFSIGLWNYIDPPMLYRQFCGLAEWLKIPCDMGLEPLMAEWCSTPNHILDVLRLTLCYFEAQLPVAMYCPHWRCYRSKWIAKVVKATKAAQLARCLAKLESVIRPVCFQRAWTNTLGHLTFQRSTAAQREEDRRMRQLDRSANTSTPSTLIRTKTPTPVRHTVWKYRGEEYRRLGGDGWMWLSSTRRDAHAEANLVTSIRPPIRRLREQFTETQPVRGLQHGVGWGVCPEYLKDEIPVQPPTANECRGHVLHPITGIPIYLITRRIPYVLPPDELRRINGQARLWESQSTSDPGAENKDSPGHPLEGEPSDTAEKHEELKVGTEGSPAPSPERMDDEPPVLHVSYCLLERVHFPPVLQLGSKSSALPSSRRLRFRLDDLLERRQAAAETDKRSAVLAQEKIDSLEAEIKQLESERSKLTERLSGVKQEVQSARIAKAQAIKAKAAGVVFPQAGSRHLIQHSIVMANNRTNMGHSASRYAHPPDHFVRQRAYKRRQIDEDGDDSENDYHGRRPQADRSSATPLRRSSRQQRAIKRDPDFVVNFDDDDGPLDSEGSSSFVPSNSDQDEASDSDFDAPYYARRIPQFDGAGDEESNEEVETVRPDEPPTSKIPAGVVVKPIAIPVNRTSGDSISIPRTVLQLPLKTDPAARRVFRIVRPVNTSLNKTTLPSTPVSINGLPPSSSPDSQTADGEPDTNAPHSSLEAIPISTSDGIRLIVSLSSTSHSSHTSTVSTSTMRCSSTDTPAPSSTVGGLTVSRLPSGTPVSSSGTNPVRIILSSVPSSNSSKSLFTTSVQGDPSQNDQTNSTIPTTQPMTIPYQPAILRRTLAGVQSIPSDFKLIKIPSSQSFASAIAASTARQMAQVDVPLRSTSVEPQSRRSLAKASQSLRLIEDRTTPVKSVPHPRGLVTNSAYGGRAIPVEAQLALDRAVAMTVDKLKKVEDELSTVQSELAKVDQKIASLKNQVEQQKNLQSLGGLNTAQPYSLTRRPSDLSRSAENKLILPRHLPPKNAYRWPKKGQSVSSLFRWHPDNLRPTILAAGRQELPGYDVEKKRLTQVAWPYQSSKPTLSECWRFRLSQLGQSSANDLAAFTLLLRTLWHCLRWDDILADPPEDGHVLDAQGRPCYREQIGTAGNTTIRKVVGIKPLDKYWKRANYLVQLTHSRLAAAKTGHSRSNNRGRPSQQKKRSNKPSPFTESPSNSPASRRRGGGKYGQWDTDDSDYDPSKDFDVRSSIRRSAVGRRSRRGRALVTKQFDSDAEESADERQEEHSREIRVEEQWIAEGKLQLWEIRTFMNTYLPPGSQYPDRIPNRLPPDPAELRLGTQHTQGQSFNKNMITLHRDSPHSAPFDAIQRPSRPTATLVGMPNKTPLSCIIEDQRFLPRSMEPRVPLRTLEMTPNSAMIPPFATRVLPAAAAEPTEFAQLPQVKSMARSIAASRAAKASVAARKMKIEKGLLDQATKSLRNQLLSRRRLRLSLAKLAAEEALNDLEQEAAQKSGPPSGSQSLPHLSSPPHVIRGQRKRGRPPSWHRNNKPKGSPESSACGPDAIAGKVSRRGMPAHRTRGRGRGRGMARSPVVPPLRLTIRTTEPGAEYHSPSSGASTPSTCPAIGDDEALQRVLIPDLSDSLHHLETPAETQRAAGSVSHGHGHSLVRKSTRGSRTQGRGARSQAREIRPPASLDLSQAPAVVEATPVTTDASSSALYCLCRTPYDPTREYLGCDLCQDWFHFECVGLSPSDTAQLGDSWHCPECRKAESKVNDLLYCLCRTPYEPTRVYIACDGCDEWYHAECVGMTPEQAAGHTGSYLCPKCSSKDATSDQAQSTQEAATKTINETALDAYGQMKLLKFLERMKEHKMAWPLVQDPDPAKYPACVALQSTTSLSKLTESLQSGAYKTLGDFAFAANQLFTNARLIYPPGSPELHCTDVMEAEFIQQMRQIKPNLPVTTTEPSPPCSNV